MELELNIKTAYWADGKVVRLNSSKDADRAVGQAIIHMRRNSYRAEYCEVFDANRADLLLAQVKVSRATGKMTIYDRSRYKQEHANRYAATPLLHDMAQPLRRVK